MKQTPLYDALRERGGRFVEFGGFEMPVQFEGILSEHGAVRENAGLFDVSHMGEVLISGAGALNALQVLFTNDFTTLRPGKVRYTLMLNGNGGVVDDILVYCFSPEKYMLCVNAGNRDKDYEHITKNLPAGANAENLSEETAQIAVQGPNAVKIIGDIFKEEDIPEKYYSFRVAEGILRGPVLLSRTGYTAEDGFEAYCDASEAVDLFNIITEAGARYGMKLCGLGARDTLRLEGGMPLYGHEMDEDTLATELDLDRFIKTDKPAFIGKDAIMSRAPEHRRIGLILTDRGIARAGDSVYSGEDVVGTVTSGTMSPTLGKAVAMARVYASFDGSRAAVSVRGRLLGADVVPLPFYTRKK